MKEYVTPRMTGETFAANEYIAACWGVACATDEANILEWRFYRNPVKAGITHDSDHCGLLTNQWVIDDDNDGTVDRMVETGTDGLGDLDCIRYTDSNYNTPTGFSDVQVRSYIYWTTTSGDRTWHHQGTVMGTDPSHPNRS